MENNIFLHFWIDKWGEVDNEMELQQQVISLLEENISMNEHYQFSSYKDFYEILQMIDMEKLMAGLKEWWVIRSAGRYDVIPMQHRVFSWMMRKLQLNVIKISSYFMNKETITPEQISILQEILVIMFSSKESQEDFFQTIDESLWIGDWYCITKLKKETQKVVSKFTDKVKWDKKFFYKDVVLKYPHMQYLSAFDTIYADNGDLQAYREFIPYRELKTKYELSTEEMDTVLKWKALQDKNRNACKNVRVFHDSILNMLTCADENWEINLIKNRKTISDWKDKWYSVESQKKAEVWNMYVKGQYGTFEIIIANWHIIAYWDSTLPFIWWPINKVQFIKIPWERQWLWLYHICIEEQKQCDTLITQLKDEHNLASIRMFQDVNMPEWEEEDFTMEENKITNRNIQRILLWNTVAVSNNLNLIQTIQNQANTKVWLNSVILWQDGRVARVSADVSEKKSATDTRIASFIDNINAMASSVAQKMLCYILVYCNEELKERIGKDKYDKIKNIWLEDIIWWISIIFDSELVLGSKQQTIDNILQLLQYTWWNLNDPRTGQPVIFRDDVIKFVVDNQWLNNLIKEWDEYDAKLNENNQKTQEKQVQEKQATQATSNAPAVAEQPPVAEENTSTVV